MVIYNVNPRVKKLFLAFHFFEWKIGIELRNSDIEMKIGKTTICAADIDRDKFQISELDPIQNLRKKKKKRSEKTKYEKLKQIPFDICRPPLHWPVQISLCCRSILEWGFGGKLLGFMDKTQKGLREIRVEWMKNPGQL